MFDGAGRFLFYKSAYDGEGVFMVLYSLSCLFLVPSELMSIKENGGLKPSRTLRGFSGYKNPSVSSGS